ncbi:GTP pyrophosphokinase [Klebsiella pneumoniae]|uniref:HD domain-containing protein n=1 Tax=Klebsiella pneumoniae TaxID=573 RepID=UPI000E2AD90A|nr:HD domain-containing protein [Klebsiella pneumoniae]RFC15876.1 guanosine polyphosphate pyrophosphohydrolase [Klebsiella pneumoniae]SXM37293.1 GTP pyrophosphokinase [Klebsiella pneumoniae]
MSSLSKAFMFAAGAHGGVGQKRKYTGEDYIHHPDSVRSIVAWYGGTVEMQIAALLHDVVEDTHVTIEMVREHFGERVAEMVLALTNIAKPEDGNRVQRFVINVLELSQSLDMQTRMIKLADLLDNTSSIVDRDPEFSAIYLAEKELMLKVLFENKEIGADERVVDLLEKKGIEHALLIKARDVVVEGIASLQPVHMKRFEKHKALIWGAWESA